MASSYFIKEKGKITINPIALMIPEFKAVWDKYEDKDMSDKELAYVHFVADYKSDYASYGNDKAMIVAKDIMPAGWLPDLITKQAISKYKELQKTPSMQFLEWAIDSMYTITSTFKNMAIQEGDTDEMKERKMDLFDPSKIIKLLKDVEPILTQLDKMKDKVMNEEKMGENKIRGGGDIGFMEDPEAMKFLNT